MAFDRHTLDAITQSTGGRMTDLKPIREALESIVARATNEPTDYGNTGNRDDAFDYGNNLAYADCAKTAKAALAHLDAIENQPTAHAGSDMGEGPAGNAASTGTTTTDRVSECDCDWFAY